MDRPILYKHASLRFFGKNESHVSRLCRDDVLLLVYDGILRFSENGIQYELRPGDYHIQMHDSLQAAKFVSDTPKYLYVHFLADWTENDDALPRCGTFEYAKCKILMEELDILAHSSAPYIVQAGKFYELLSSLYQPKPADTLAGNIADYIAKKCHHTLNLDILCAEFHFSKNHIINTFKQAYGVTPVTYITDLRLRKAEYLIDVTSDSLEHIAVLCGFNNYSNFYKRFCRKNGLSPEKWREQKRTR